jgi:hypothetical protein
MANLRSPEPSHGNAHQDKKNDRNKFKSSFENINHKKDLVGMGELKKKDKNIFIN